MSLLSGVDDRKGRGRHVKAKLTEYQRAVAATGAMSPYSQTWALKQEANYGRDSPASERQTSSSRGRPVSYDVYGRDPSGVHRRNKMPRAKELGAEEDQGTTSDVSEASEISEVIKIE